jgi:hypothetical protein
VRRLGERWWRVVAPFVAAAMTVLVIAFVAGAHDTDLTDPDDATGKLDIQSVRLTHDGQPPQWRIVTYRRWTNYEMWDRGFIEVLLDTRQSVNPEYYLLLRTDRWRLTGTLWRIHAVGPDAFLGTVNVSRPSLRSATVQVRLGRLSFGEQRDFYRWRVHTVLTSESCPRTCHDRAPNGDWVVQWRPGRSPTPTFTTTATATP